MMILSVALVKKYQKANSAKYPLARSPRMLVGFDVFLFLQ